MNKAKIILTIGIWVALLPYLGFPYVFKNILFTLTGLILFYLSYLMYKESKNKNTKKSFDSFSENNHFLKEKKTFGIVEAEENN